ncbi:MAG: ATP-dependent helicase [Litorilinea sp.]
MPDKAEQAAAADQGADAAQPASGGVLGFTPRPAQARILEYTGGPMGIAAVPGSGKTFTLSLLAARLVDRLAQEERLDDSEVLVVTLTNSAVENFRSRIAAFLRQEQRLLPGVGYRVRTLHGLAHDIVRERPALVGLSEGFDILDEQVAAGIKRDSVLTYLRTNPEAFSPYIEPERLQNPRAWARALENDAIDLATSFIRMAKEQRVAPHVLQGSLRRQSGTWPLLDFGIHVYADYQRSLAVRGAVDFSDLITLALTALESDADYLARLQRRWPYVLEDEAQDSGLLQEQMLRLLTQASTNWVRVGDPNQAINTTFTSADIRFLRDFVAQHQEQARTLPNSGRSARPIIDLANRLNRWSRRGHPILSPADALSEPLIELTPPGDPQPNPQPGARDVVLHEQALSSESELEIIVGSLKRWLRDHPHETVAVLVPDNHRGTRLVQALEQAEIAIDDTLLSTSSTTRAGARMLAVVARFIAHPNQSNELRTVWHEVWWLRRGIPVALAAMEEQESSAPASAIFNPTAFAKAGRVARQGEVPQPVVEFGNALGKVSESERFLFPREGDWLDTLGWLDEVAGFRDVVEAFRRDMQRWSLAASLPIDELLLTLGNDLFDEPADLALAHRLAVVLARLGEENPDWRLPKFAAELQQIAENRRRIPGLITEVGGFEAQPGKVTVGTMHQAKGLEWDRVYLTAVNSYSFPSGSDAENYRGEPWYARDSLNLTAEAMAQLQQLIHGGLDDYAPGAASLAARQAVAAERLRLFYVGITRARRELIVTYNTGRQHESAPLPPAVAFQAMLAAENGRE